MRTRAVGGVLVLAMALGGTSCGAIESSTEGSDGGTGSDGSSGDSPEAHPVRPCSLIPDGKAGSLLDALVSDDTPKADADLAVSETTAIVYDACRWEEVDEFGIPVNRVEVGVSVTPVSFEEYEAQHAVAKQEAAVLGPAADGTLAEAAGGEHPQAFFASGSEDGPYGKAISELFVLHRDRVVVVSAVSRYAGGPAAPLLVPIAAEAMRRLPEQVELSEPAVPEGCSRIDRAAVNGAVGVDVLASRGSGSANGLLECAFAGPGRLAKVGLRSGGDSGQVLDALAGAEGTRPVTGVGDRAVVGTGGILTAVAGDRLVEVTIRPDGPVADAAALARAALAADR